VKTGIQRKTVGTPFLWRVIMDETKAAVINKITAVLEPAEEGGYTVYVPALPGCISEEDTLKEAITNIRGRER